MSKVKDVVGYDGMYSVSSNGLVFNKSGMLLKQQKDKDGYCMVNLSLCGVRKTKRVHRLVAESFIPNPDKKKTVNHINGLKNDNRVENLEWCSIKENTHHAMKMGLRLGFGDNNPMSKITEKDAIFILESTEKPSVLSSVFGIDVSTIRKIQVGRLWKHLKRISHD